MKRRAPRLRTFAALGGLSLAFGALACGTDEKPAALKDLEEPLVRVTAGEPVSDGDKVHATARVSLSAAQGFTTCWKLGTDLHATFNGASMNPVQLGGADPKAAVPTCAPAVLDLQNAELPAPGLESTVVVADATRSWEIRVKGLGWKRTVSNAAVDPTLWVGDRASLSWSDNSDVLSADHIVVTITRGDQKRDLTGVDLSVSGRQIGFTVPDLPEGTAKLDVAAPELTITACTGDGLRCEAPLTVPTLDATLRRR